MTCETRIDGVFWVLYCLLLDWGCVASSRLPCFIFFTLPLENKGREASHAFCKRSQYLPPPSWFEASVSLLCNQWTAAVAQPVAELQEHALGLCRTELSLWVGWLGYVSHTPQVQAVATSAWALLQVLSALGFPCLEEGLWGVLNGEGISWHEGLLDGVVWVHNQEWRRQQSRPRGVGGYPGVGWMTLYIRITPLQFDGLQWGTGTL